MYKVAPFSKVVLLRFVKLLGLFVIILAILGCSAAILSMLFGKPIGDDYGAIASYRAGNRIHEAIDSLTTTGRYMQSISSSILYSSLGEKIVIVLPLTVLTWFSVLSYLYARFVLQHLTKDRLMLKLYSAVASVIFTFLVLFINRAPATGNLDVWTSYQLFFWPSGIITYTLALLVLATGIYLLFISKVGTQLRSRTRIILFAFLIFITALFNESQPALVMTIGAVLLVVSYLRSHKRLQPYRTYFLSAAGASLLGLIALFFSPGRMQRSQMIATTTPSSHSSLLESVCRNFANLLQHFYLRPSDTILLILVGMLATLFIYRFSNSQKNTVPTRDLLVYSVTLVLACAASVVIAFTLVAIGYGYNAGIYLRTMLACQLLYVVTIPFIGYTVASIILRKSKTLIPLLIAVSIIGLAFIVILPKTISKLTMQVNSSVTYSNGWVDQDTLLRKAAANNTRETVYLNNPVAGIGDGFSLSCTGPYAQSTIWLNQVITQYYGNVDRICTEKDKSADAIGNYKWIHQ